MGGLPNGGGLHPGGFVLTRGSASRGPDPQHANCSPSHPSASTGASGAHPTRMHSCFQLVKLLPYYSVHQVILNSLTRMHSVGCVLAAHCPYLGECTWSGGVPSPGGMYLVPRGCTWSGGSVPGPWGVYLVQGGVPGLGGCTWSLGVYLVWGVYLV